MQIGLTRSSAIVANSPYLALTAARNRAVFVSPRPACCAARRRSRGCLTGEASAAGSGEVSRAVTSAAAGSGAAARMALRTP